MLKFTSIVGYTSCGPTYIKSFLTIFGQCINVLNYNMWYSECVSRIWRLRVCLAEFTCDSECVSRNWQLCVCLAEFTCDGECLAEFTCDSDFVSPNLVVASMSCKLVCCNAWVCLAELCFCGKFARKITLLQRAGLSRRIFFFGKSVLQNYLVARASLSYQILLLYQVCLAKYLCYNARVCRAEFCFGDRFVLSN